MTVTYFRTVTRFRTVTYFLTETRFQTVAFFRIETRFRIVALFRTVTCDARGEPTNGFAAGRPVLVGLPDTDVDAHGLPARCLTPW